MTDGTSDLTNKNHPNRIHWARLPDGDTDYSDWQIDVKFIDGDGYDDCEDHDDDDDDDDAGGDGVSTFSYLVHRYKIGPQCTYFAAVFSDANGFSEGHKQRSIIEFPVDKSGANRQYFEDLLDFLYEYDSRFEKKMEFETDQALAMLYFADYFGIETIREQALEFLRSKVTSTGVTGDDNYATVAELLAKVYITADRLSIEELQDAVAKKFGCYPSSFISHYNHFLHCLRASPESQRKFVHRTFREYKKTELLCYFLDIAIQNCPDIVDKVVFSKLTGKEIPGFWSCYAIDFLKHEQLLGLDERDTDELTCLQQQCVDQLFDVKTGVWQLTFSSTPKEILQKLRGLKPAVMESLLLRTIERHNNLPSKTEGSSQE